MSDAYKQGFLDGITAYAWHKDGKQWVGTTGRILKEAQANVEKTWNYAPPMPRYLVPETIVQGLSKLDPYHASEVDGSLNCFFCDSPFSSESPDCRPHKPDCLWLQALAHESKLSVHELIALQIAKPGKCNPLR